MKTINIIKYISILLAISLFTTSCEEDNITREQSPTVADDCSGVRFADEFSSNFEIDPDILAFDITLIREYSTEALSVPITLTDTSGYLTLPSDIAFAAGDTVLTFTIGVSASTPSAKNIGFELNIDESFVNPYLAGGSPVLVGSITVVKWNALGKAQFYDSFSFYSVIEVDLEQRDDDNSQYRISYPYTVGILTEAEWDNWIGGNTQEKITFKIAEDTLVTWDGFWYTNLLNGGNAGEDIKAYLPSSLSSTLEEDDLQSTIVTGEDGTISYFSLNPYFYVDGLGGWGLKPVYLGFPGFDLAGALEVEIFSE